MEFSIQGLTVERKYGASFLYTILRIVFLSSKSLSPVSCQIILTVGVYMMLHVSWPGPSST